MPTVYDPKSPEGFLQNLKNGKYASLTNAKKAIGTMKTWTEEQKARAIQLGTKYFANPAKFSEVFYPTGRTEKAENSRLAPPSVKEVAKKPAQGNDPLESSLLRAKADRQLADVSTLSASVLHTLASYETLSRLVPGIDVSEVQELIPVLGRLGEAQSRLSSSLLLGALTTGSSSPAAPPPEKQPVAEAEQDEGNEEEETDDADKAPADAPPRPSWMAGKKK